MTELELMLQSEIEKEKEFSKTLQDQLLHNQRQYEKTLNEIKTEYEKTLNDIKTEYMNTLKLIASSYNRKLKELCDSDSEEDLLENGLEMRLRALEVDLSNLRTELDVSFSNMEESLRKTRENQVILGDMLKRL